MVSTIQPKMGGPIPRPTRKPERTTPEARPAFSGPAKTIRPNIPTEFHDDGPMPVITAATHTSHQGPYSDATNTRAAPTPSRAMMTREDR